MNLFKTVSVASVSVCFIGLLSLPSLAQSGTCRATTVEGRVSCANIIVEYADIATDRLQGEIYWAGKEPVRIEVYKIKRSDRKKASYNLTSEYDPLLVFDTDAEGRFCYPGLPDGNYVLKIGIPEFGWNCTYVKVRILKGLHRRSVEASVEIGI